MEEHDAMRLDAVLLLIKMFFGYNWDRWCKASYIYVIFSTSRLPVHQKLHTSGT
jgi:hypothetical protein